MQLGQMLGDRGRADAHMLGQVVHRMLTVEEGPHDAQTGRVGQQFEGLYCPGDLLVIRVTYLRIHAGTIPVGRLRHFYFPPRHSLPGPLPSLPRSGGRPLECALAGAVVPPRPGARRFWPVSCAPLCLLISITSLELI